MKSERWTKKEGGVKKFVNFQKRCNLFSLSFQRKSTKCMAVNLLCILSLNLLWTHRYKMVKFSQRLTPSLDKPILVSKVFITNSFTAIKIWKCQTTALFPTVHTGPINSPSPFLLFLFTFPSLRDVLVSFH